MLLSYFTLKVINLFTSKVNYFKLLRNHGFPALNPYHESLPTTNSLKVLDMKIGGDEDLD